MEKNYSKRRRKMKILTAIGNNLLRERLEEENFDVYKTDLQYQEAVLHILKENNKINILFLNSILPGDLSIYEFINKNTKKEKHNCRIKGKKSFNFNSNHFFSAIHLLFFF